MARAPWKHAVEKSTLADFVEQSYLDYSMYVILDRALPSICDGLKPVQRRIIYAMSELGLSALAKPKKSARTIGDVIGKYHPHGETACYEAMVLMSQDFSFRHPLIEGQGNWGSIDDPKSFAAMRYTEARMTAYAGILLNELDQGTVAWRKNFDGTLDEPEVLPAQLPNLLINGASGIAIGMSTNIPPHNLSEVCQACMMLLDSFRTPFDKIMELIQGPDFPGGGLIVSSKEEIKEMYKTGSGSICVRAEYTVQKNKIAIHSLPYQTSITRILQQIRSCVENKKLNVIKDLVDESDQENPVRIIIHHDQSKIKADELMLYLFTHTDLERKQRIHLNVIGLDRKPTVKPLLVFLKEWLDFRCETVRQRLRTRIQVITRQLEILEGFKIAFANLDQIIQIIRTAKSPKTSLMQKLKLTELQANAILEIRLRKLAKLEQTKIEKDHAALSKEKSNNERCLNSNRRLKTLVKKEIKANLLAHEDTRRSTLSNKPVSRVSIDQTKFRAEEEYTVAISKMGWIRVLRGYELDTKQFKCKSGDAWIEFIEGTSNQSIVLLDTTGRCYTLPLHKISVMRTEQPLGQFLNMTEGARCAGAVLELPKRMVVLGSTAGYALQAPLSELTAHNRSGKQILSLKSTAAEASQIALVPQDPKSLVVAINYSGHILAVPAKELIQMRKGKGRKLISINKKKFNAGEESMVALMCLAPNDALILHSGQRRKKLPFDKISEHVGKCAQRGLKLLHAFNRIDSASMNPKK